MHVMEVKGECSVVCGERERLSRMFLFLVYLGFQTKIKDVKIEHCYFVFRGIMGGIRDVQEVVMVTARLLH
jgi:hypothetical protein